MLGDAVSVRANSLTMLPALIVIAVSVDSHSVTVGLADTTGVVVMDGPRRSVCPSVGTDSRDWPRYGMLPAYGNEWMPFWLLGH